MNIARERVNDDAFAGNVRPGSMGWSLDPCQRSLAPGRVAALA